MSDEKFNNPFAKLGGLRESLPSGPEKKPAPAKEVKGPARAVVRLERTGRGGKEVTLIEHLELQKPQRETWLKELKSAMGCGGVLEDEALVLQGDLRERVAKWLEKKGVRKVTVAN
ncbi:MAG: translation initiation factor [Archangium sp.]|nr:translation initiation factor [Archangium sp.]